MPYPAKVLLFGEHTVLRGGRGLAVPYPYFSYEWAADKPDHRLYQFALHLREIAIEQLDTPRMLADFTGGLGLTGNIPTGYGLGSSGAVCAAILDRYGRADTKTLGTRDLRQLLSRMEAFFHGQSSGTDPLVSYLRQPLLLQAGGGAGAVDLPHGWQTGFFLIDTGISRQAPPLIASFLETYDQNRIPTIDTDWAEPVETAITALLRGERKALHSAFARISDFQLTHFPGFIPPPFRPLWGGGEHHYRLKLCGAGGGGMLLGLSDDRGATKAVFGDRLQWLDEGVGLHATGHE